MAFGQSTINGVAGAASDIFGGYNTATSLRLKAYGDTVEAGNYDLAADLAGKNEKFTETSTAIKEAQATRQIYQGIGTETADIAGAGLSVGSGSSLDLLRSSAQQGALTKAVAGQQGLIQEAGYKEQQTSFTNMAVAARYAASVENEQADKSVEQGWITGGLKLLGAGASMFTGS